MRNQIENLYLIQGKSISQVKAKTDTGYMTIKVRQINLFGEAVKF